MSSSYKINVITVLAPINYNALEIAWIRVCVCFDVALLTLDFDMGGVKVFLQICWNWSSSLIYCNKLYRYVVVWLAGHTLIYNC